MNHYECLKYYDGTRLIISMDCILRGIQARDDAEPHVLAKAPHI
jgi:hypothetical protein